VNVLPYTTVSNSLGAIVRAGTPLYARVRAFVGSVGSPWSPTGGPHTPVVDVTPPAVPANLTADWSGVSGALTIRCDVPTAVNIRTVRYRIFTNSVGTLLRTVEVAGGLFVWTLDMQRLDRGGLPLPASATCYIIANTTGWGGAVSADVALTATLAAPATPAGVGHSWESSAGTASADWLLTWTPGTGIAGYRLTLDGLARDLPLTNRYPYPFTLNAQEHASVADPVLAYSLAGVDALGQTSATPASGTATNAAPPAVTITALLGIVGTVALRIGTSLALDLKHYRVRVYRNAAELTGRVFVGTNTTPIYDAQDGAGSYQFSVAPVDLFDQVGAESALTTAFELEPLTISIIREGVTYIDSLGTAPASLNVLKDDNRTGGGVNYAATNTWRFTEADRQFPDRLGSITITATAGVGYVGVSYSGGTYRWYAGPLTDTDLLSFIGVGTPGSAAELAAQAAAAALPVGAGTQRWRLPDVQEARLIRLGHRSSVTTPATPATPPQAGASMFLDTLRSGTMFTDVARTTAAGVGDAVASWFDPVSGVAATQSTAGSRPVRTTLGIDFSNDFLTHSSFDAANYTIYVVMRQDENPNSQFLVGGFFTGIRRVDNTNLEVEGRSLLRSASADNALALVIVTPTLTRRNNSDLAGGASVAVLDLTHIGANSAGTLLVPVTNAFFDGELRLVLYYPTVHTTATMDAISSWAMERYGVIPGTLSDYRLDEFYPRSKIVADDFVGENFTGITINGSTINGGTINGAAINGGIITGGLVRTAASGARVELDSTGLKTYDSAGNVQIEATTATDGALLAGAGRVTLDRNGLSFLQSTLGINFFTAAAATAARIAVFDSTGLIADAGPTTLITRAANATLPGEIHLTAAPFGVGVPAFPGDATVRIFGKTATHLALMSVAGGGVYASGIDVGSPFVAGPQQGLLRANDVEISNALRFNAATPAAAPTNGGRLYVDSADGDLKIIFANGTVRTIAVD